MTEQLTHSSQSLVDKAGFPQELGKEIQAADDHAWIEVIHRMDSIYTDLVRYQVELEEKNAELEETQSFIQSVISSISDVLIVCDINGYIQQVNQSLEKVVGKFSSDLTGEPLSSLISEEYQSLISEFPEHIRSGSLIDCEIDLMDSKNNTVPMAINCSSRYDHENRLSGFVITGRPLGELRMAYSELHKAHEDLKTAQQRLTQSEKMASLGRLVAGVAHELNNPISYLYANMHALQSYEAKFIMYLDTIHKGVSKAVQEKLRKELNIDRMMNDIAPLVEGSLEGAERVSEIVRNLRKFSTSEQGKKQKFDLIPVINRAISWVLKASSVKPEIITNIPGQLELVNNEGSVHQILINLFQNAVDAMENIKDPKIFINIKEVENMITISIRDTGSGISVADMVKIFDPFFTTKAVGSGTGLGLYISYGLATDQCQGDLYVNNQNKDGAEFVLSLPIEIGA